MKPLTKLLTILLWIVLVSQTAFAGDFDWVKGFNIQAERDPSGFRARMEARFKIGDVAIRTVIGKVERPSDAYIIFRLGEISGHPVDYVLQQYTSGNGKAWGVLAKQLGIKPGSTEFHALKQGEDLFRGSQAKASRGKGKAKSAGKGKGRK